MPEGGESFYINSFDGHERYEDFFIKEFIPAIDGKYRTIARREARGISGVSMGGYGSLHLGMRHPDVFGSASAHSAALIAKIPDPLPTEGRWGFYARVLQAPFGNPLSRCLFRCQQSVDAGRAPGTICGPETLLRLRRSRPLRLRRRRQRIGPDPDLEGISPRVCSAAGQPRLELSGPVSALFAGISLADLPPK